MSREITPFGLRMPSTLKSKIEKMAAKNRRSLNAEIVVLLETITSNENCLNSQQIRSIIREELDKKLLSTPNQHR